MANEFGNLGEGLDIGGAPRQDVNKVTEEAVRRIQEESKKSTQVQQQIKDDKQTNNKLANFITFLLKEIKNEKIISLIYELFFKTKQKNTGTTYIRKRINTIVIIGFFFPFYTEESKKLGISNLFEEIHSNEPINLTGYINYIKRLSEKYHDNIALDSSILIEFLINIISHYKLFDIKSLDKQKYEDFVLHIKNQLYN